VGYFASAILVEVYNRADDPEHCVIELDNVVAFKTPRPMLANGAVQEAALLNPAGAFPGWRAAEDVREISTSELASILAAEYGAHQAGMKDPRADLPLFRERHVRIRDPKFTYDVYRAYQGRCAISLVRLLNIETNECGLEAAHIYPYWLEPWNTVSSGILLAPTWHARYDAGLITLHDDYSWYPNVEDADTEAIRFRHLHLPMSGSELPDIDLIRRNRERLAAIHQPAGRKGLPLRISTKHSRLVNAGAIRGLLVRAVVPQMLDQAQELLWPPAAATAWLCMRRLGLKWHVTEGCGHSELASVQDTDQRDPA
jgi:hypothetical protein